MHAGPQELQGEYCAAHTDFATKKRPLLCRVNRAGNPAVLPALGLAGADSQLCVQSECCRRLDASYSQTFLRGLHLVADVRQLG